MSASRSKNVRIDESNGQRIVIRWFSPLCWGLLLFCVLWNGSLVLYFAAGSENPALVAIPHLAAGIAVTYLTLALFFNRTTVSVGESETTTVRHWPFPWIGNMVLPTEEIRDMRCVPGLTITGAAGPYKTLVNIKAMLSGGSECLLIRSLDNSDASVVRRQIEKWLSTAKKAAAMSEAKSEKT